LNQRWTIVYQDKKVKEPTSGMNKDFGFKINKPFYIRSRLPMRRVIQIVGARNARINSFVKGRKSQQFIFDQRTKTIKSMQWRHRSLDIQSSGRSQK